MSEPQRKSHSLTLRSSNGVLRELRTDCFCDNPLPNAPAATRDKFVALWDTGATNSCITQNVVDALGLVPTGVTTASTAAGAHRTNTYLVTLRLPHGVRFLNVPVTRADLGGGVDVLIGMDIITIGDFCITHGKGKTVFSFRVPSMLEIDFVAEQDKANALAAKKPPVTPGQSFHRKRK